MKSKIQQPHLAKYRQFALDYANLLHQNGKQNKHCLKARLKRQRKIVLR